MARVSKVLLILLLCSLDLTPAKIAPIIFMTNYLEIVWHSRAGEGVLSEPHRDTRTLQGKRQPQLEQQCPRHHGCVYR